MTEPTLSALVVEDDAVVRQLTMRALAREDFRCDAASNGVEASERLAEGDYDVVVVDLQLPIKNGHAVATEILSQAFRPGCVILTGVAEPKIANDLVVRGVDGIVFKPVNFMEFAANVKKVAVARRQRRRSRQAADLSRDHAPSTDEVADVAQVMADYWDSSDTPPPTELEENSNHRELFGIASQGDNVSSATAEKETRMPGRDQNHVRTVISKSAKRSIVNRSRAIQRRLSTARSSKSARRQENAAAVRRLENRRRPKSDLAPPRGVPSRATTKKGESKPFKQDVPVTTPMRQLRSAQSLRGKSSGNFVDWLWKQVGESGTFQACLIVLFVGFASLFAYQTYASRQDAGRIPKLEDLGARVSRDSHGNLAVDRSGQDVTELINELTRLQHVHAINMSTSNITDNDLASLGRLKSLRSLNLNNTGPDISDKGATNLLPLSRLRELQLNGTNLTMPKIRELELAIPGLKVDYERARTKRVD